MKIKINDNAMNNGLSQLRRMVMRKTTGRWTAAVLLTLAMIGWSTSAHAATITFFDAAGAGGTLSYGGNPGDPMVGASIGLDSIIGGGTPLNNGVTLACVGCTLSFTTGAVTTEGPPIWSFGGNAFGSFTVTGSVPALGISGTLLVGSISLAGAFQVGQLTGNVLGPDIKRPEIVAFYGLTGMAFNYANTDIVTTPTVGGNGSFSGTVETATITNVASVPVPDNGSTMAFLGLGLLGVAMVGRKILV
jgi:hypothetical protein